MKKIIKMIAVCVAAVVFAVGFTGCGGSKIGSVYEDKQVGFQLELPAEGDTVAIMHTSEGDIYLRLFPEAAPKAVENFTTLAKQKYYNGLTFHRVIQHFMIQGGDPKGDGTGGESIFTDNYGAKFEDEFDSKLINLRGSLAMANAGPNTNGSQFFINHTNTDGFGKRESYSDENIDLMYQNAYREYSEIYGNSFTSIYGNWQDFKKASHSETYVYDWVPDAVWDLYEKHGGNLSLDGAFRKSGGHTVFGQVFRGMDVVDAIAGVEVDSNDKPVEDVIIKSIEVTTYTADMAPAE